MEFLAKLQIHCQEGAKAGLPHQAGWPGAASSHRVGTALNSRTQTHSICM